jgi:hypothetical protein
MEIKDLYVASNQAEQQVVAQIAETQWRLVMPEKITRTPMTLEEVVRYHIWDDAWLPDVLAGKTKEAVGDAHEHLLSLTAEDLHAEFATHNQRAIAAVRDLEDLDRTVHLSYGDFPAREYLQHNVSVRAFWSYDMAKLIGVDATIADDLVAALTDEFTPVAETYRQIGHFPPAIQVPADADPQTALLAMAGRE